MANICTNYLRVIGNTREDFVMMVMQAGDLDLKALAKSVAWDPAIQEEVRSAAQDMLHYSDDAQLEFLSPDQPEVFSTFLSPWAPPIAFIGFLASKFSYLRFVLEYIEPGIGYLGRIEWEDGVPVFEKECELSEPIDVLRSVFSYLDEWQDFLSSPDDEADGA